MASKRSRKETGLKSGLAKLISNLERADKAYQGLEEFTQLLLAGREDDATLGSDTDAVAALAARAYQFLASRPKFEPKLAVEPLTVERSAEGEDEKQEHVFATVLALNDDMPFLLDSIIGEIQAHGHQVRLVTHPLLHVRRSPDGGLEEFESETTEVDEEACRESVIAILLDGIAQNQCQELAASLSEVLAEVRGAVAGWRPMLGRLDDAIAQLERAPSTVPADLMEETIAFCKWLRDGQFTFLGMREYKLEGSPDTGKLVPVDGSGLGILSDPDVHVLRRGTQFVSMTPEVRRFFFAPVPIIITKSNVVSRIHRRSHMDYVGLKTYASDGTVKGELRMVGLYTSEAYNMRARLIPFLRLKINRVLASSNYPAGSHAAKALVNVLETFPRDELFQIGAKQLSGWAGQIIDLDVRPRTLILARVDRFDRFVSVLAFLPRDRFSTAVREKTGAYLADVFHGEMRIFKPYFTEGPLVRVHYIIARSTGTTPDVPQEQLEQAVGEIIRTWEDQLGERVFAKDRGNCALFKKYGRAFPAGYTETFTPDRAIEDIERIERLADDRPQAIDFYHEAGAPVERVRAAIYRFDHPIPLSERVPLLENMGFRVIDERSYRVHPHMGGSDRLVCLHDMVLEEAEGEPIDLGQHESRLEDCFIAITSGDVENDRFNRLVIAAGANWREAAMMRGYASYMRQIRAPFGPVYIANTLARHGGMTRDLIELFHVRFDPDRFAEMSQRDAEQAKIRERFEAALAGVESLDEDRILRMFLNMMLATKRTNYFQCTEDRAPPRAIAFKIASQEVDGAPEPRPFREIYVSSPRVNGVHLRFAPIARGGLRWSDRPQDFRTEVLGLAKAQQVKNTVIVPQGSKGGFVAKQLPRTGGREAFMAEGVASYQMFVSTMLDITDNLVDGNVLPPERVVRQEGDDPYLVVAADKGTATFSDHANKISQDHDFWLGDAFASGGSAGYDHKKMGITARGAWECVKRHFREMDIDIQTEAFTVTGVGDMSGDVFGNGMLLSPMIRLVAAFDHRDIFIDPDPDHEVGFAERKRLFELPRSSWQDYDTSKISNGGGVFSRSAKSIPLSEEMRAVLGVTDEAMTPNALMQAILKAQVDLFWLGGIGTYVRAPQEANEQAGDRANDAIRITSDELGAKVVGEGANLGLTQRARIAFADRGGRINTDFIDNSAGVNSSDQEVNIKIALLPAVRSGKLDEKARLALLESMTEDVAEACLRNNYDQSLTLSLAERGDVEGFAAQADLLRALEERGLIDRKLESLPSDAEFAERTASGHGFTRPELSVLLSYAKIALSYDLLETDIPDHPALEPILIEYFPDELRGKYLDDLKEHRLRREIITTHLTNAIINHGGPAIVSRLCEETGSEVGKLAEAYIIANAAFEQQKLWDAIDALDTHVPGNLQLTLYGRARSLVRARMGWMLRDNTGSRELVDAIELFSNGWRKLADKPGLLTPTREAIRAETVARTMTPGVPQELADSLALHEAFREVPDITVVADACGCDIEDAATAYFAIADHLGLSELKSRADALSATDTYDRMLISSAVASIETGQRTLAEQMMRQSGSGALASAGQWLESQGVRTTRRLADIASTGVMSVSRLMVAASEVGELAGNLDAKAKT